MRILLLLIAINLNLTTHALNAAEPAAAMIAVSELAWQGDTAYQQGNFQQAITAWEQAFNQLDKTPATLPQRIDILTRLGAAYQNLGMHRAVLKTLQEAILHAEQLRDAKRSAIVLSQFSDAWLTIGDAEEAIGLADDSLADAELSGDKAVIARAFNAQANALTVLGYQLEAIDAYQKAAEYAQQAGDTALSVKVLLNKMNVAMEVAEVDIVLDTLPTVETQIAQLGNNYEQANSLIALGWLAQNILYDMLTEAEWRNNQLRALNAYQKAAEIAATLKDNRTLSLAYGRWGQLYEEEARYGEAQKLTRQAIFHAKQGYYPDVQYLWEWQQGRLFVAQGDREAAIESYRRAAQTLKPIQNNLDVGYRNAVNTFDSLVRPVYYELADLLLQKADTITGKAQQQSLLKEARETVELVKRAELQNYFQDECVLAAQARAADLDEIIEHTAVIYPIPLYERLVLLVSLPTGIQQIVVPVTSAELFETAVVLRESLQVRSNKRFIYEAQALYNWLVRPAVTQLRAQKIDTLVFVPDGSLRLIPISTLHDGEQFLIEEFAVVTTPGLTLTDPKAIDWQNSQILLVGLSDGVQGYSPLPNVPKELQTIEDIAGRGSKILNSEFSYDNFRTRLRDTPYSIIHMATHGEFSGDPEETYLLTYQEKMTMDKLQDVIGLGRFRKDPVELLTLSACKTAVGDDRSALGLAGVAVKAGARSAIATLWYVDDEATSLLVTDFYRKLLETKGITKAKAMQRAQTELLQQARYAHPIYWAPFLLIGNWL